jgi:hypothetical protein
VLAIRISQAPPEVNHGLSLVIDRDRGPKFSVIPEVLLECGSNGGKIRIAFALHD